MKQKICEVDRIDLPFPSDEHRVVHHEVWLQLGMACTLQRLYRQLFGGGFGVSILSPITEATIEKPKKIQKFEEKMIPESSLTLIFFLMEYFSIPISEASYWQLKSEP